jgi:serine/threonine protein kinase
MPDSQQRYRVVEKLESGGMAEVFRAESEGLQGFRKQVAIKRVLPHLSEKKKFISMFLDEARLSAQLSHSNCVQVFDIGVGDNAYFIVMEFVDGANLKAIAESLKKQGKEFPVQCAAFIALEICKGLAYAHELSDPGSGAQLHIVHRDMSPPNVLVTKFGEIKIVDFGLAKANSQLEKSEPGIIKGKFSYLSPEAAMGGEVDLRTDIFAVGIILWELLSGQRLFLGETDFQTVKKVQQASVPLVSTINKKVPPELDRILTKTLARDPAARYQTARELGQDLSKFMFSLGQPVSTFDIAILVQTAMKERQRKRIPQGSIIDKLIEEALLEFTSLTDDDKDGAIRPGGSHESVAAAMPLNPAQFVDPTNWAKELGESSLLSDPMRLSLPAEVFEHGNLSALEDDLPSSSSPSGPSSPSSPSDRVSQPPSLPPSVSSASLLPDVPTPGSVPPRSSSGRVSVPPGSRSDGPSGPLPVTPIGPARSSGTAGVVVVMLVAVAAVAAAWFGGLIHH